MNHSRSSERYSVAQVVSGNPASQPLVIFRGARVFLGLAILAIGLLLVGCSTANPVGEPPRAAAASPTLSPQPTFTPTASPTPAPTLTTTSSATPTVTPTPTATLHPMSVAALRQGAYPGSDIIIHEPLEPGANYSRYYASYQSEGYRIYALLTIPDGEPPPGGWPGIVFNHGYIPPTQYRTTERYIAYVDWLARAGYVVFRIDYRGHHNSEGPASGAYGDPGYTVDVLNAVSSLQRWPQVNPERIGMWGHSMGGYLTLRAMVVSPQVRAGVIWAGVVASYPDLLTRWRRPSAAGPTPAPGSTRSWRSGWVQAYGLPAENPDFWASVSSNTYLADLNGRPIQLHHGTADESVPLIFSTLLQEQMQAAGQTVELYTYEGDNHNLSNFFSAAMNHTIQFFDQYLKDQG